VKRAPNAEHYGRRLRRRPELEARAAEVSARPPVEVWASRDWLVQIFHDGLDGVERITVNRTTLTPRGDRWADRITWDELQQLKADTGRGERWALEVYPPAQHLVDDANMRHLFVVAEAPLFAWLREEERP